MKTLQVERSRLGRTPGGGLNKIKEDASRENPAIRIYDVDKKSQKYSGDQEKNTESQEE